MIKKLTNLKKIMEKAIVFLLIAILLTSCSNKEDVDSTSSATSEWNSDSDILSEADKQFNKLRQASGKENQKEEVRTVRKEVTKYLLDQFDDENLQDKRTKDLRYKINNKAMSTSFNNDAKYIIHNSEYDYEINILAQDKIDLDSFTKKYKTDSSSLVTMKDTFGQVLVSNINNNSYASKFVGLYDKGDTSYIVEITSEYMSIPEILVAAELFYTSIN